MDVRQELQANFERIILRLEYVSPDGAPAFRQVCAELERFLDDLKAHGQKEMELLQHSFAQEEGGSGGTAQMHVAGKSVAHPTSYSARAVGGRSCGRYRVAEST